MDILQLTLSIHIARLNTDTPNNQHNTSLINTFLDLKKLILIFILFLKNFVILHNLFTLISHQNLPFLQISSQLQ